MSFEDDGEYKPSATWNKKEKKSNTFAFVAIALICFLLSWVII